LIFVFKKFNWVFLPLILLLTLCNYFARFLKWQYYLKILDVKIKLIDSISIFFSGFVMSITPGKMGELLKSYLVKEVTNTPISKTAPIIRSEEHTSELQSRENLVCRLLLEKKKMKTAVTTDTLETEVS